MNTTTTDKRAYLSARGSSAAPCLLEIVRVDGLVKSYADPQQPAVSDFDLSVDEGEILCLLGPSGCGKTTLLRLIAGFEVPDSGTVHVGGREVVGPNSWVPPERRAIGFVFQDYALFPHLTVLQNVAFGVRARSRRERLERAEEVLGLVGLTVFSKRYPHQLSGGQQQRVALARALAPGPEVILLDEPFSNLDAALREATREEVRSILKTTRTTTIMVTHDQEEALTFGDRLAVMRSGWLEQLGTPEEVYKRPRTAFVAKFLGRTNLLRGTGCGEVAETIFGPLPLTRRAEGRLLLSLRPEDLTFGGDGGIFVDVLSREFKGHDLTYLCRTATEVEGHDELITVQTGPECRVQAGETVRVSSRGPAVPLEASTGSVKQ
ncbi:MAG TPA: ABC transporter ATP-binding protein [Trueperaceae bacterium]